MPCSVAHSTFQVIENPVSLSRLAQELLVLITAVAWMCFSPSGSIHRGQIGGCLRNAAASATGAAIERGFFALRRLGADPDRPFPRGLRAAGLQVLQFASSAASAVVQPDSRCFCGATCLLIHVDTATPDVIRQTLLSQQSRPQQPGTIANPWPLYQFSWWWRNLSERIR